MKILLVNEFAQLGGAEQIANNQMEIFEDNGHDVKFLCFNKGNLQEFKKNMDIIPCCAKVNRILFKPLLYAKIRRYVKQYNPDIVIIHSLWSSPLSQYPAFKGFNTYQIVHDYNPICPNSSCVRINGDKKVCEGYRSAQCLKQCYENGSKVQLIIKYVMLRILEPIRKKYVKLFISPSSKLNEYLLRYGYNSVCINNPLGNIPNNISDNRPWQQRKKFIYAGSINKEKGILHFIKTFIVFSQNKEVELNIFGNITDDKIKKEFYTYVKKGTGKIKYHGMVSNTEVRNNMKNSDFLVMPSMWMENYPTSILEAMSEGIVVIGSDRGGIPEMLTDGSGIVYKFDSEADLIKKLNYVYLLNESEYKRMQLKAFEYVKGNNSYEMYYYRLMRCME